MAFSLFPKNLKQWKVVLIAFLAATTFWFFNSLNKEYSTSFNYPISFKYNRDSLVSVRRLPEYVSLDVTSGGWSLLRKTAIFSPNPLEVNLEGFTGSKVLSWTELLPSFREQVGDIGINQILQDTLNLQIEPIKEKIVQLSLDSSHLSLASDYRVVSPIKLGRQSVSLRGPASFIDTIQNEYFLKIQESDISEDFEQNVDVWVPYPNLIKAEPASVEVTFEVAKYEWVEISVPVEVIRDSRSSLVLDQESVNVLFLARESVAEDFQVSDFSVIADLTRLRRSDTLITPVLTTYPMDILELKFSPEEIKLKPRE